MEKNATIITRFALLKKIRNNYLPHKCTLQMDLLPNNVLKKKEKPYFKGEIQQMLPLTDD